MKRKNNMVNDTKRELLKSIYQSKTFKVAKYGGIALIGVYGLGYVFKILAFTNTNLKVLKNSFKSQK